MLKGILGFFADALGYDLVPKALSQELPPRQLENFADPKEEAARAPQDIYFSFKAEEKNSSSAQPVFSYEERMEEGWFKYRLSFPEESKSRLDEIGRLTDTESIGETICHALALWSTAVEEVARGGKVGTYSKGGKWREINLPFASRKRR